VPGNPKPHRASLGLECQPTYPQTRWSTSRTRRWRTCRAALMAIYPDAEFDTEFNAGALGAATKTYVNSIWTKLKMTPIALGDGKIRLKVSPEVSDLEFYHGRSIQRLCDPGSHQP